MILENYGLRKNTLTNFMERLYKHTNMARVCFHHGGLQTKQKNMDIMTVIGMITIMRKAER